MQQSFNCLRLFENTQYYILELAPNDSTASPGLEPLLWLLIDLEKLEITKLILLATNFESSIQERFFKQGYLSFDSMQAIFIREGSSVQLPFSNTGENELSQHLKDTVQLWLSENDMSSDASFKDQID